MIALKGSSAPSGNRAQTLSRNDYTHRVTFIFACASGSIVGTMRNLYTKRRARRSRGRIEVTA